MSVERTCQNSTNTNLDFVISPKGIKSRRGFNDSVLNYHKPELFDGDDFIVGQVDSRLRDYWTDPEFRKKVKIGGHKAGQGSILFEDPVAIVKDMMGDINKIIPLSSIQRKVLEMRFIQGHTQTEVGEILGKTNKMVSKIERKAILVIHNEKRGGFNDVEQAQILLSLGMLDLNVVPGLSDREREIVGRRCISKQPNIEVAREMGIPARRTSESYRAAIQKVALFVRDFKRQAQDALRSEQ